MRPLTSRLTRANVRITVLALIVLGAVGAIPAAVASALPTSPPSDSEVSISVAGSGTAQKSRRSLAPTVPIRSRSARAPTVTHT